MGATILSAESYINDELRKYQKAGWVEQVPELVGTCYTWYQGFVKDFHKYYIKTGSGQDDFVTLTKLQLNMGKKVGEDWANHLINEKCDIVIPNEKANELLDTLLQKTKSWVKLNKGVEQSFALGYGCMVQGVKDLVINDTGEITSKAEAYIINDFVPAVYCRPLTFVNREVEDIAFLFENTKNINIIMHIKDTRRTILVDKTEIANPNYNNYDVVNVKMNKMAVDNDKIVQEAFVFRTNSPIKLFQIIQPNIANNVDLDSPLAVSVYANAIPVLKAIDNAYDSLNNEIELGRKRIVADEDQFTQVDEKGNRIRTFDTKDGLFYAIPRGDSKIGDSSNQFMQDISGQLRVDQIVNALNQQLNTLSSKVGLGENYYRYSDAQKGVTTATQVISENSTLYKTMRKHEILLEDALQDMVLALIYLNNTFTSNPTITPVAKEEIKVVFDDSIIEDTEAQKTSDRQDVNNGVMSKVEYRMKYYGEDEETAIKNILKTNVDIITKKAEQLTPLLNDGYITATAFVKLVYGEYGQYIPDYNEAELIAKIEESVVNNKPAPSPFDEINLLDEE